MKKKKGESKEASVRTRRRQVALFAYAFCLTFSFFLFPFSFSSAHEPITTKVRFNKEVVRILQKSCLGCHHTGGIAMSLAAYDEARPWAKAIKEELLEKRMPPWHAVKGYGDFRNAPSLTQRDVELIVNWVEGGAPKGDDKDLPTTPLFSSDWQLGKPDLIVKPDAETRIAADADEHRVFTVATGLKQDRWLRAIDLQPGNGSVVLSAVVYAIADSTRGSMATTSLQSEPAADALRGAPVLATWMPGQRSVELDQSVGLLLPAASRLALKIHYRGTGEASTDLSAIGLYFAKTPPPKTIRAIGVEPDSTIPVSSEPYSRKLSFTVESDSELIAIRPRAQALLVSLQATAYRPDGTQEVLIWTRGYQFDWQPTCYFRSPVVLPKGTRIEAIAYFDNSDDNPRNPNSPPKPVKWSELASEYLCTFLLTDSATAPAKAYSPSQR